jgi:hypothetical protein
MGGSMSSVDICALCAWRANCQKKFSVSGKDMRCPDFSKDLSIAVASSDESETENEKEETEREKP